MKGRNDELEGLCVERWVAATQKTEQPGRTGGCGGWSFPAFSSSGAAERSGALWRRVFSAARDAPRPGFPPPPLSERGTTMADFLPVPGPCLREEPLPGPEEAETEAELSLSLAFAKTRSYGSTASVAAPLAERYLEHRLGPGDTLQGIALKYGVTMEQIKRANKLFTNDCIFLRKTLNIPVMFEKPLLFNGLNSLESPENEIINSPPSCEDDPVTVQEDKSSPSPQESDNHLLPPEELSAKDFLHRLDLQIKLSKQAARKLKPEDTREEDEENPYATSSYQQ